MIKIVTNEFSHALVGSSWSPFKNTEPAGVWISRVIYLLHTVDIIVKCILLHIVSCNCIYLEPSFDDPCFDWKFGIVSKD